MIAQEAHSKKKRSFQPSGLTLNSGGLQSSTSKRAHERRLDPDRVRLYVEKEKPGTNNHPPLLEQYYRTSAE